MERVYPKWKTRYPYFFDNVLQVERGLAKPPELPGLGLQFRPGLFEIDDVVVSLIAEE
ncbi:MAG: hypothetical protein IPL46_15590 [Saprospiraceae bacterium]|nr:hypothetical protein [Saprospiraceae bacterium]